MSVGVLLRLDNGGECDIIHQDLILSASCETICIVDAPSVVSFEQQELFVGFAHPASHHSCQYFWLLYRKGACWNSTYCLRTV